MRYTQEQISAALILLKATGSPEKVIETLGYPSNPMLYKWRDKYPELYGSMIGAKHYKQSSTELKSSVIHRCFIDGENVKSVAEEIGYTPSIIYHWCRRYKREGMLPQMKKQSSKGNPVGLTASDDLEALNAQIASMQMEIDILTETIGVLKKDQGFDRTVLRNREKAVIVEALKNKHSLPLLLKRLELPKSSFYYQRTVFRAKDKYLTLRGRITDLFHANRGIYGYRRIYKLLKDEGTILSEKVVRRLMKEERLLVKIRRRKKYNSYKGEISPAVPNLINRDFQAEKPNQKWLTDITEFSIKAGKVYLSPIIDCLDGMPVTWTIGTSPTAALVNTMLKDAINTLKMDEKPIVHSDRGCHYRWPEWISIMEEAGLKRSMSEKGCSPDNAACEGFFGHLKTEMFYNRTWDTATIDDLIEAIHDYMNWYRKERIKSTLEGLSPLEYRRRLGLAV